MLEKHIDNSFGALRLFECVLICLGQAAKSWRNHAGLALQLSEFAGHYRQSGSFKTEGKAMSPVLRGQGKQETENLFATLFSSQMVLDISKVAEGGAFMNNIWYWGYDAKLSLAHFPPNAAAMVRVVAAGELRIICFNATVVARVMRTRNMPCKLDAMVQFMLDLKEDDEIVSEGFTAVCKADDVIYVPTGFILCEKSMSGGLLYGCRKSYLIKSETCMASYKVCSEVLEASGRNPDQNEEGAGVICRGAVAKSQVRSSYRKIEKVRCEMLRTLS